MVRFRFHFLLALAAWLASACSVQHHHHAAPNTSDHPASPSTEVGAGGGGVLCKDNAGRVTSFEVLDVYEARVRGMQVTLGAPTLTVEQKIAAALDRLRRLSPERAARYRRRAGEILASAQFFRRGYLPRVGDEDPTDVPEGCRLVQIATRRKPIFAGDREFLIDGSLYDQLDRDNQAALILHEVVYEEGGKRFGHRSSRFSRAFLSTFLSRHIEGMTVRTFFDFLHTVEFKATDYGGISVPTLATTGDGDTPGKTVFAGERVARANYHVEFTDGDYSIPFQELDYFGRAVWLGGNLQMQARFSTAGRLIGVQSGIAWSSSTPLSDRGNTIRPARDIPRGSGGFFTAFHDDGRFELLTAGAGSTLRIREGAPPETLAASSCVALDPEGRATVVATGRGCEAADWPADRGAR